MKYIIILTAFIVAVISCNKPGKTTQLVPPDLINKNAKPNGLTLSMIKDTIAADTTIYAEVTLKVADTIANKYKVALFTISPIGSFDNHNDSIIAPIDISGSAHVFVNSKDYGHATIKAFIGNLSRDTGITFTPQPLPRIHLSIINDSVYADNYSFAQLVFTTNDLKLAQNIKKVTFTTDKGTFSNDSRTYDANTAIDSSFTTYVLARAFVKDSFAEKVRVSVTFLNSITIDTVVNFIPSLPQNVFVNPDSTSLKDTLMSNTKISVLLTRSPGIVSPNRIVYFKDSLPGSTHAMGTFTGTTLSDNSGKASTQFWIQDTTNAHGKLLYIEAMIVTGRDTIVRGYNQIYLR